MGIISHIKNRKTLYLIVTSWMIAGVLLPNIVAIVWSVISMLFILRTDDRLNIFLGLLTMLIFSDGRGSEFQFAADAKVFIVLMVFAHIVLKWKEYRQFNNPLFKYMLPFFIFAVLATLWATSPLVAFQKSVSYSIIFFVVPTLISRSIYEERELGKEFMSYVIVILGSALVIHFIAPEYTTLIGRYKGLFGNPNGLGIFLIVTFTASYLFWAKYKDEINFGKIPYLFLAVLIFSLLLAGSRTAIFSIIVFFIFLRLRYLTNIATVAGFIALILGYEYLFARLPEIINYLNLGEYMRIETLQEGSGRNVAWTFAWDQIQHVYFTGGGFGHTQHVFYRNGMELSRLGHQGNAHSSYLTLWLDTGLIGILLYVSGFIMITIRAVKNSSYTLPIVISILFSTYFESWLAASLNPFTSVFIMTLTVLSVKDNNEEEDHENTAATELTAFEDDFNKQPE